MLRNEFRSFLIEYRCGFGCEVLGCLFFDICGIVGLSDNSGARYDTNFWMKLTDIYSFDLGKLMNGGVFFLGSLALIYRIPCAYVRRFTS